ncbi:phospholipid scramblase-related protein [Nocardia sp. CA-129566]|uniref:phospholipid scramblase-related protein n=1 Tax=Nocardia sp. CA-129566 TaxID=3239976 RepID=UPI003D98C866
MFEMQQQGPLYTAPALIVHQTLTIFELAATHDIFDQNGARVGAVAEIGEDRRKMFARFLLLRTDSAFTRELEIRDEFGARVLAVTRPRKMFKNTLIVHGPNGEFIGKAVQEKVWGKKRFSFVTDEGQRVGGMDADGMIRINAWSIRDETGNEVATFRSQFTMGRTRPLPEPLASMTLASALTVDMVLGGKWLPAVTDLIPW